MARLYSRMTAAAVDDPEFGHYDVSPEHGGFDFPDELSDRLHRFHHRGTPAWETEDERTRRLHGEEAARRRDPESLYNAVEKIAELAAGRGTGAGPGVVGALMARLEAVQARLDELEAKRAGAATPEGDGSEPDAAAPETPESPPKASRGRAKN